MTSALHHVDKMCTVDPLCRWDYIQHRHGCLKDDFPISVLSHFPKRTHHEKSIRWRHRLRRRLDLGADLAPDPDLLADRSQLGSQCTNRQVSPERAVDVLQCNRNIGHRCHCSLSAPSYSLEFEAEQQSTLGCAGCIRHWRIVSCPSPRHLSQLLYRATLTNLRAEFPSCQLVVFGV